MANDGVAALGFCIRLYLGIAALGAGVYFLIHNGVL